MIPLKLSLRNFLSYREAELSLEGIHVACLSGPNGNGKSALLDAITWALWGKARAKSDDELIHLHQREMEVELGFRVGRECYRALRKRIRGTRRSPGQTILELHLEGPDGFQAITGNSVRETERKIVEILRMEYETFVNSAMLLQGRADEFTLKGPAERKRVLAEILDLAHYSELEQKAREEARERDRREREHSSAIAEMDREIGRRGEYEVELSQIQERLRGLERRAEDQEREVAGLQGIKGALERKQEELGGLEKGIEEARGELEGWERMAKQHASKVGEYEKLLTQREAIAEGYSALLEAREANERLTEKLANLRELERRKGELELVVERARGSLREEARVLEARLQELEPRAQALERLKKEMEAAEGELAQVDGEEEDLAKKHEQMQGLLQRVQHLKSSNENLKEEMGELRKKVDLLAQGDARCPLCGSAIGAEERERIRGGYEAEGRSRAEAYRSNESEMRQREQERTSLERETKQREGDLKRRRSAADTRLAALRKEMAEAQQARESLPQLRENLSQIEASLVRGDFALEEQKELEGLQEGIKELGYGEEEHRRVRERLGELGAYEGLHRNLQEAERLLVQERDSLRKAEEEAVRRRSLIAEDEAHCTSLREEVSRLPQVKEELDAGEHLLRAMEQELAEEREKLGAVRQKLERCAELEGRKKEREEGLRQAAQERDIYEELVLAFGKQGIQALIIEEALPEIEEEANRLLGRMTENCMHLAMETQRETRGGKTLETLEIKIADELGTRNYELYSGGEAFRINFALRIALSKLLARRAGAALPTLIIDEGFGTQDSFGRERLIEAIRAIQDDFQCILVITHIEELKEIFPVRIEVTKTGAGSVATIV